MNNLDWILIGVVLISMVISLFRGFVRESLSLVTWVVAIWCGVSFSSSTSHWLTGYISHEQLRVAAAFFLIFIIVLILGTLLSFGISRAIKATPLSGIDRLLGMVFGFARGLVLLIIAGVVGPVLDFQKNDLWIGSKIMTMTQPAAKWVTQFLPAEKESTN